MQYNLKKNLSANFVFSKKSFNLHVVFMVIRIFFNVLIDETLNLSGQQTGSLYPVKHTYGRRDW